MIIDQGTVTDRGGDGTSWRYFVLFSAGTTKEEALDYSQGEGCNGPGQVYYRRPQVLISKTRTLLVQQGGLDV